jgi:tRNA(Arg) A34 adenosine deaminase TadA
MTDNVSISLPDWIEPELNKHPKVFPTLENRMRLVIRFSQMNIAKQTGGPFAAGVFETKTGKLVSMGVNRVVPLGLSIAHAEIVALSFAQKKLGVYDLGEPGLPEHQLVVNWCPCVMCYGAILWSGITSLVIAGSSPVMKNITGFDEGPMHPDWVNELEKRGIKLVDNLLKEEACQVFTYFAEKGELVYNARAKKKSGHPN